MTDELKRFIALWENAVIKIRGEIKAHDSPALTHAKDLCYKLEDSMVAYSRGNAEYLQETVIAQPPINY